MKSKRKLFIVGAGVFVVLAGLATAYLLIANKTTQPNLDDGIKQTQDINEVALGQALTSIESGELTGSELAQAYSVAGTSYQQQGESAKAIEQLELSITTYKTMPTYLNLVISYLVNNDLAKAEETYAEMTSYFGTDAGKAEQYSETWVSNASYYIENYKNDSGATDADTAL